MTEVSRKQKLDRYLSADTEIAGRFQAEQINSVLRLTPFMMTIHAIVGAILIWLFLNEAEPIILLSWGIALAAVILNNLDSWRRNRIQEIDRHSESAVRMMTANAIALSLVWGIATIMLFPTADLKQQLALACIMISMMGIGAFSLASLKQAALSYVIVFTICSICALLMTRDGFFLALSGLQGVWALAVTVAVIQQSFLFAERLMTNSIIQRQTVVLSALEKDLNETVKAYRFETDKNGIFHKIERHFALKLGSSAAELLGTSFAELLADDPTLINNPCYRSSSQFQELLSNGIAFHEKLICTKSSQGLNYWRVSTRMAQLSKGDDIGFRGFARSVNQEVASMKAASKAHVINLETGLANQKAFERKIYKLLAANLKKRVHFSCMVAEFVNFNKMLDEIGVDRTSELLKAIGERLNKGVAGRGFLAHFGETGFGVLCPIKNDPEKVLQSLSLLLRQELVIDSKRLMPEVRFGCSLVPHHGKTVPALIGNAQKASNMVNAKDSKNWCILPKPGIDKQTQLRA
ncbi:MAG: diguanylate cyclase [Hyphomicrobiales bacterium]